MKRIIIPAGTVSGTKDYILEIPIDSYDQEENAIYILDDKSSRGSLSDYFYDKDSRSQLNQEYAKQYSYQQNPYQRNTQMYQSQSSDNLEFSYPSNYMLKQEFSPGNYQVENPNPTSSADISQTAKYYYYKSLGFTNSELHKLLAKRGAQRRIAEVPSQRKQMRFNRMGVTDFSSVYEDRNLDLYQYDSFPKIDNAATENTQVNAYKDMMSNTAYSQIPYNASTHQGYYEDYQKEQPNIDPRLYKQYNMPTRAQASSIKNAVRTKQSYTPQQNAAPTTIGNKQIQNFHDQQTYYPKPVATSKVVSPSKTVNPTDADQNQPDQKEGSNRPDTYKNISRNISPDASISSYGQIENDQIAPQRYSGQISHPPKRMYRTIPGTSVVSNMPNIRLRNPVAS